jgi:tryptophanyl-tRNA synthetase
MSDNSAKTPTEISEADYQEKLRQKQELESYYNNKRIEMGLQTTDRVVSYLDNPGPFFHRKIIYAHKDFERIIDAVDNGKEWTIVSGLNPSGPLHFGHKAMFDVLLWFQRELGATIQIPITSDETYVVNKAKSLKQSRFMAYEYVIPSIIALGFDPARTKIYVTSDYPDIYNLAMYLGKYVTSNTVRGVFGLDGSTNISQLFYMGVVQLAQIILPQLPEFGGPKSTLIPVGIDQHPYITLSRDVAERVNLVPPAELIWKFLISLKGPGKKMSASVEDSAIFLTDKPEDAARKIKKAYSGGSPLASMQRERGAIPDVCSIFSLLTYNFLSNEEWDKTLNAYQSGEMLTGELKKLTSEYVLNFLSEHHAKREQAKKNIPDFMLKTPIKSFLEMDNLPGLASQ